MLPQQKYEVAILLGIIAASALAGALINQTLLAVSLALFTYIIFMLRNLFKLQDWLVEQKTDLPDANGYWGEIFNELHLLEKQKSRQKKLLSTTLSRFKNAAEALPDGVVILTPENEIEWINPVASNLLGINYPQDSGQKIGNLIRHPDFQLYLNKNNFSKTITLPAPANSEKTIVMQIIPFGYKQKMIFCRDVSHIAKLEEMRSNFVSNVSHEMRSPLTVVAGYLEMLMENPPEDEAMFKRAIENMFQQTQRMQSLVTDLLALSKMETKPVKHNKIIDVTALLTSLKENAEIAGNKKQQTITLVADKELRIRGNNEELHSLFSNLINNAVRYTPEKGHIDIEWKKMGNEAVFSVKDDGPGIAARHLPHLTERFYRADADRSRETGGTGLGLAIAKYAVERHDGRLQIKSILGKGSTFSCYFPAQRLAT